MEKFRKSVFVVIYRKTEKGIKYLLLKRKLHWVGWEFPKGGIDAGEKTEQAIKREVKEETGQSPFNMQNHNFSGKFLYGKEFSDRKGIIGQEFSLYSAEISNEKIMVDSDEHSEYLWLPFSEAYKKLAYENQKKSLEIVNEFLEKISKFRVFNLVSGNVIFLGKNAKSNDELMKLYEGKENTILHTSAPGSPFGVIKDLNPPKKEIYVSGSVVAGHSRDWRENKSDVKVNIFTGKDISKPKLAGPGTWKVKKSKTITIKKEDISR